MGKLVERVLRLVICMFQFRFRDAVGRNPLLVPFKEMRGYEFDYTTLRLACVRRGYIVEHSVEQGYGREVLALFRKGLAKVIRTCDLKDERVLQTYLCRRCQRLELGGHLVEFLIYAIGFLQFLGSKASYSRIKAVVFSKSKMLLLLGKTAQCVFPCKASACGHNLEPVIPFIDEQADNGLVKGHDTHLVCIILVMETLVQGIKEYIHILVPLHSLVMEGIQQTDDILTWRETEYVLEMGIQRD